MEAIPRGLVSRDMIKALPGIKSLRTSILPANSSGNHSYTSTASNKITIQVPSFPNSFINTKRSFLRFVLKTSANGVLIPQPNLFRRMMLKNSRGSCFGRLLPIRLPVPFDEQYEDRTDP